MCLECKLLNINSLCINLLNKSNITLITVHEAADIQNNVSPCIPYTDLLIDWLISIHFAYCCFNKNKKTCQCEDLKIVDSITSS